MERQSVDEQRHRHASESIAISAPGVNSEDDLGLQRLDAEYDEFLARQSLLEAALIELVLLLFAKPRQRSP